MPNNNFLKTAETYYQNLEKFFFNKEKLQHTILKKEVFLEDYAYSIAMLLDLYDETLKPSYLLKAKKLSIKAIELFYIREKSIFQKNQILINDLFHVPIDISDNNLPNGNSVMLLNFTKLGMLDEAKELSESLNKYLNNYRSFMASSLKAIDYFNSISNKKNCNDHECTD